MEENRPLIRRMERNDAQAVHAVETACFQTPWSLDSFEKEMDNPCARYLVAELDGSIIAFAGIWIILDEGHITNIAVVKEHRGKGYGRLITAGLLQYASNLGVSYATLEVRRSNETARRLYQSLGFSAVGYRKRYYEDNGEDALLMVNERMPPADPDFQEPETARA